ncbi:MAG: low-specificity L-threonine aldolase [Desulfitobacteriaceae bacterium]
MDKLHGIHDFRSDTVTLPTPEMRRAMAEAEVGDDVYGEDPTLLKLERVAAERVGKEAALFVTSGTQGNLVAVLSHTQKGDEVVLEAESHIYYYEVGGMSVLGGVIPRTITGKAGVITPETLGQALRGENIHFPRTTLLCIENTHNRAGGTIWTPEQVKAIAKAGHEAGLKIHMDGARVFNAAVAQGVGVEELVGPVDSVMFCLSKGLSAPVGSILAGSKEFIVRARKWRKMLGGGMRQAGILAAAGLVALETMVERLAEDHALAKRIGEELAKVPYLMVDMERLQTNIVLAEIALEWGNSEKLLQGLREEGVLANDFGPQTVRFVVHKDIGTQDAERLITALNKVMA